VDLDARSFVQAVLCNMIVIRQSPCNITFEEAKDFYAG
jgi:hypothetical protein